MPIKLHKYRIRLLSPSCWVGLFLLVFLFGTSCKTYQKVDWIRPKLPEGYRNKSFEPRQLSRITEGDSLLLITQDSGKYYLIYSKTVNDSIQGLLWKYKNQLVRDPVPAQYAISEIEMLKVRKFNLGATLTIAIGVPVGALAVIGSVILYQGLSELEGFFYGY